MIISTIHINNTRSHSSYWKQKQQNAEWKWNYLKQRKPKFTMIIFNWFIFYVKHCVLIPLWSECYDSWINWFLIHKSNDVCFVFKWCCLFWCCDRDKERVLPLECAKHAQCLGRRSRVLQYHTKTILNSRSVVWRSAIDDHCLSTLFIDTKKKSCTSKLHQNACAKISPQD